MAAYYRPPGVSAHQPMSPDGVNGLSGGRSHWWRLLAINEASTPHLAVPINKHAIADDAVVRISSASVAVAHDNRR